MAATSSGSTSRCTTWRRAAISRRPTAIAEFAAQVRGREGLRNLYLLTVADISTTSPTSMTRGKRGCSTSSSSPPTPAWRARARSRRVRTHRAQVEGALEPCGSTRVFLDEFLKGMPERYLLSNTP